MSILITDESYNNQNALYANVGDWVDGELKFSVRFQIGSGVSNKFTYNNAGGNYWIELDLPTVITEVAAGDAITLNYTAYPLAVPFQNQVFSCNITYVTGNKIYIDAPFLINPFAVEHATGQKFPEENMVSGISVIADKAPKAVEFDFNLLPNGGMTLDSIIDNEINGFALENSDLLTLATPTAMTQLVNKSGGLIKDVTLELTGTPPEGWRTYKVAYKFFQWAIIQNGFPEPNYYVSADCVAPLSRIKAYAEIGNPIGVQTEKTINTQGNTGEFNENYNGGVNLYSVISMSFIDLLGDPIGSPDYSNPFTFTAIINAPNQVNPTSTYRMGMIWRPVDSSYYQNIANFNLGENLLVNAPEVDFIADASVDATQYAGLADATGAQWDFKDLKFELTGASEVTITGQIIPNAAAKTLFNTIPDGGRKTTIWVSLGDQSTDGTTSSRRVSLTLFDGDNIDAPTKGVQIPNVVNQFLFDHNSEDITTQNPQTTTEDDVLYTSEFKLIDNVDYEGIRTRIYAFNTVTNEEFTLEDTFFSFSSVVNIAGQFQPNFVNSRGFNLPPATDRNLISLIRKPSLDVAGKYGLELKYGYLSRWEYWLEQSNADNDFFDITEPNNGKNKNWQRISANSDWIIRLSYYTRVNGVDDFNHFEIGIRPYEDEDVTTSVLITVLSDGSNPNELKANELNQIDATLLWNAGIYSNAWAEATIEDYESGNRWVISSVLAQGGIASNPLKPKAGFTMLDLTFPNPNEALLSFVVDTNIISANKVSQTYRIESDDSPPQDYPVTESQEAEAVYGLRKLVNNTIYPDSSPCIRVRRDSDNLELDIGFTGSPLALDTAALLDFVSKQGQEPTNHGWVVTVYDQSGWNRHATQSVLIEQQRIVDAGSVEMENGKPTFNTNPDSINKSPLNMPTVIQFRTGFTVAKVDTNNTINYIIGGLSATGIYQNGNLLQVDGYGVFTGSGYHNLGNPDFLQHLGYVNIRSFNIFLAVDGAAETNAGSTTNTEILPIQYLGGKKTGSNLYLRGNWQEVILFDQDKSGVKATIENNINGYYNIY